MGLASPWASYHPSYGGGGWGEGEGLDLSPHIICLSGLCPQAASEAPGEGVLRNRKEGHGRFGPVPHFRASTHTLPKLWAPLFPPPTLPQNPSPPYPLRELHPAQAELQTHLPKSRPPQSPDSQRHHPSYSKGFIETTLTSKSRARGMGAYKQEPGRGREGPGWNPKKSEINRGRKWRARRGDRLSHSDNDMGVGGRAPLTSHLFIQIYRELWGTRGPPPASMPQEGAREGHLSPWVTPWGLGGCLWKSAGSGGGGRSRRLP